VTSTYRWRCLVCEAANEADVALCAKCGFPARSTGREIIEAQLARKPTFTPRPKLAHSAPLDTYLSTLAPLSFWRKLLVNSGMAIAIAGMFWFKAASSWAGIVSSVVAVALGGGMAVLGLAGTDNAGKAAPGGRDG